MESILSSSSSSCSIEDLPDPILIEILCRVPYKTLTASMIVSKSWLNLIRDPQFHHLHQSRAPAEVFFQPYNDNKEDNKMKLYLGNFDFPNNIFPCRFEFPKSVVRHYKNVNDKLLFANSCNGLLCYYAKNGVKRFALVWNPCTSEFITFPPPQFDKGSSIICRGYGLGFSSKSKKFKLLRLMGRREEEYSPSDVVAADVCAIEKACSWKRIDPCSSPAWFRDYYKPRDLHAVFFQGTLHWVGADDGHYSHIALHTFDFEDDRFGRVPLPQSIRGDLHPSHVDNIGVLGGCLFVAEHKLGYDTSVIVWLMKEYGVEDSWTKLFCLGSIPIDKGISKTFNRYLPITYMDNGEILMKCAVICTSTVVIYNPVLKSARVVGTCPVAFRAIAYSPSLVMLKDSMLGYHVHAIPKYHTVGLEWGEVSKALVWKTGEELNQRTWF